MDRPEVTGRRHATRCRASEDRQDSGFLQERFFRNCFENFKQ
jgi:hypothetical protein